MNTIDEQRDPVVEVLDASLEYPAHLGARPHAAVQGVSLTVTRGQTLALLGESGSGKSTLARVIAGRGDEAVQKPDRPKLTSGRVEVFGTDVVKMRRKTRHHLTGIVGYLSQTAGATLPPDLTIGDILTEPLRERDKNFDVTLAGEHIAEMFDTVGLPLEMLGRYPYELSKGQRQRVAVMQSLMLTPRLLVADEPTLGIDALHRPSVVRLLRWYRERNGATLLLICHDIAMLEELVDEVVVMQEGQSVGRGSINTIFRDAEHAYVQQLAQALRATAYDESAKDR